jgi:NIPSNAP
MSMATRTVPAVVELRQYSLLPGKRDVLIDLFEANFIESQEACGITVIGTFRDLDDETRFVWLRGFADMTTRRQNLADFYYGPVWQRHRDATNSTMVDSDDVLLLRPARCDSGFLLGDGRPVAEGSVETDRGIVEATILRLARPAQGEQLAYVEEEIAPRLADAGRLLGCLVTEYQPNNFPALPVREGEHVIVWLTGYRDQATYDRVHATRADVGRIAACTPELIAAPHILRLAPHRRSRLTGDPAAAVPSREPSATER